MRKLYLSGLVFFMGIPFAGAIEVQLLDNDVALGLPVTVVIQAEDEVHSLDRLDLSAWKKDFIIQNEQHDSAVIKRMGREVRRETLRLRLYAHKAGSFSLPGLVFEGKHSRPVSISVLPQEYDDIKVQLRSGVDRNAVLLHEEVLAWVEIRSSSNIDIRADSFSHPAFHTDEVILQRQHQPQHALPYVRKLLWPLLPLKAGTSQLKFPLLHAGGRRLYQADAVILETHALANYLPGYIPVTKITRLQTEIAPNLWQGQPSLWKMQFSASGLSSEGLRQQLTDQLRQQEQFQFYPMEISIRREEVYPYQQAVSVTIPFVAKQSGRIFFPGLLLSSIDPRSTKLETIELYGSPVAVRHPVYYRIGQLLWFVLLVAMLVLIAVYAYRRYYRYRVWQKWRGNLLAEENPSRFLHCMLQPPTESGIASAVTAKDWLMINAKYNMRGTDVLRETVNEIQAMVYSQHSAQRDFVSLKQLVLDRLPFPGIF